MLKFSQVSRTKGFYSLIYTNCCLSKYGFATLSATACCYDVLGIRKTATSNEIKEAYLALVKKYHPDHNNHDPDAEENFKVLSKAYETLKNTSDRQTYDSNLNNAQSSQTYNAQNSQTYTSYRPSGFGTGYSGYQDYSNKYQESYEKTQRYNYRSVRRETNSILSTFIGKICLGLMLVFALQYAFSSKSKAKTESDRSNESSNRPKSHPGQSHVAGGNSRLGEVLNNPLFVRERPITAEILQQEMAKNQFRIEHTHAVVRGPPGGEDIKKKWVKEKNRTVKGLDKVIKLKGFELKKSTTRRMN